MDELPAAERARLKARQGVPYPVLEGLTVADPASLAPVPADGATICARGVRWHSLALYAPIA
jgi:fatty-acyl-CoA synthase